MRFALSFSMGKTYSWGPFTKCGARLNYCLILGPLFWNASTLRPYIPTLNFSSLPIKIFISFRNNLEKETRPFRCASVWTTMNKLFLEITLPHLLTLPYFPPPKKI